MYKVSELTTYDEDKMLFETYVGLNDEKRTLLFSAWGNTEQDSQELANKVCNILNQLITL